MKTLHYLAAALFTATLGTAQNIEFSSSQLYPEGTAYSAKQDVFFVSSIHYGRIGKIDRKGNYTIFINDPELITSVGLLADEKRNLLYVAIADNGMSEKSGPATANKLSKIAAYDLTTGKRKYLADLAPLTPDGANFVNDITIDPQGNLYATNSFAPVIYKVSPDGKASVFAKNDQWKGEGYNLNGIVYHPDGYLIVAQSNIGVLYKIDVAHPENPVKIDAPELKGADGLILNGKNELLAISHASYNIYRITTKNNWKSAAISNTQHSVADFPTTGVLAKGKYYVLNAKLNEFFDPKAEKTANFLLQEVYFK